MSAQNLFLAVYTGSKNSPQMKKWEQYSDAERDSAVKKGISAWQKWAEQHKAAIVENGGPLGKTKSITDKGVVDITNNLSAYTIVRAASHDEAAKLFLNHPHFTIFPGDGVEVMPVLPRPGEAA